MKMEAWTQMTHGVPAVLEDRDVGLRPLRSDVDVREKASNNVIDPPPRLGSAQRSGGESLGERRRRGGDATRRPGATCSSGLPPARTAAGFSSPFSQSTVRQLSLEENAAKCRRRLPCVSAGDCRSQLGFVGSPVASFGPHSGKYSPTHEMKALTEFDVTCDSSSSNEQEA
ncbi:hypothetical protein FQA47_000142 [Oryzias melastigma]|uniref:Uncharacterized protein n=1 Tax=Oryzias melastigma TaxID=30732 RepID=A0A834F0U1_ORYME|nr:hypothetical protein FQA47_000142 [Oryzias melastigma]